MRRPGFDHCKKQHQGRRPGRPGRRARQQGGCLDRCAGGPVAVVYPDETWYTFVDHADIDEIVESHLKNGKPSSSACVLRLTSAVSHERASRAPSRGQRHGPAKPAPRFAGPAGSDHRLRAGMRPDAEPPARRAARWCCAIRTRSIGGTMDNKVVQTLARAFLQLGYRTVRFNFRGVGGSAGGLGRRPRRDRRRAGGHRRRSCAGPPWPAAGAGRLLLRRLSSPSPGGRGCRPLAQPVERLVLVGPATSRFTVPPPCRPTPWWCTARPTTWCRWRHVLDWARPQALPVTCCPASGISSTASCRCSNSRSCRPGTIHSLSPDES
jgi:(2Fe-2S) ferredoxin